MYPRAPDMRRQDTQGLSDGELYAIIKNGVRLTGMPGWGDAGDADRDSWALVALIRHLPKVSSEELEEMRGLNPMSAHQLSERKEEDSFLNEGP